MGLRLHVDLETNRGPTNKLYIRIDSWKVNMTVGEVKFTGQILPIAKKVEYLLDFKRIIMRKLILGIADGRVICDDKLVFEASDIRVGLFQD